MYLDTEKVTKLNHFRTQTGRKALEELCNILLNQYIKDLSRQDGSELFRIQGKLQLIEWLQQLPKGLTDASNGSDTERMGGPE